MRTYTPADLAMTGINLKALATTTSGIKVKAADFFQFSVHVIMNLSAGTPTTGLISLGVNLYTGAVGATALVPIIGVTSINTKTPTLGGVIWTFGAAGSAVGPSGTKSAGADTLKVIEWVQPFLTVTEVVDVVATATAEVYLQYEGYNR